MAFLEKELCKRFLKNPEKNPKTGSKLSPFLGSYNQYVSLCMSNGFDEEIGILLLTASNRNEVKKHFAPKTKFTDYEIEQIYRNPIINKTKYNFEHINYREYKRPKYQ